ncbi:MAG: glycoside hydrolase family 3 N-terminal domain-containing protein [Promethearchaeota archaeon]
MLIITILTILFIFTIIIGSLAALGWFLTNSVIVAILLPIIVIVLYKILKGFLQLRKIKKIHESLGKEAPILVENGVKFRDLNKNGKMDDYEDPRKTINERVEDLLSQMTLEEKIGQMFSPMMGIGKNGEIKEKKSLFSQFSTSDIIVKKKISTFTTMGSIKTEEFVKWHNSCQKLAERTRLGIPLTICSDPRHEYMDKNNPAASLLDASLSKWPHPLGLAATRDERLVRNFANIARQELASIGIRFGLHPMADLATEPRWGRINGTFGEDAELTGKMVAAYIKGFQGDKIGKESVACCVKHFPGGGAQKEGYDPHFPYGAEQIYPGNNFEYHQIPFKYAFEAGAAAVMPYYGKPMGIEGLEEVGFNFNKQITTDLLRNQMGFKGIVHTDYGIISPIKIFGVRLHGPTAWGVEHLSRLERVEKAVNAGIDQLGGEACTDLLLKLVRQGRIPEFRIDQSCRRVLKLKFELGLFDNPYVEESKALATCNKEEFVEAGKEAMRKSLVLLKNGIKENSSVLPLPLNGSLKVYVEGFDKDLVGKYAQVVKKPEKADFALLNLKTPSRLDLRELFGLLFKQGDLDFTKKESKKLVKIMKACSTIVNIYLDRPAVIPELKKNASAIIGNFSVSQDIVLDLIFGKFKPTGKLPFELPSSMDAVRRQKTDVPYDSLNPLYPFGYGLNYE